MALILSFVIAWISYPHFIALLKKRSITQHVSEYAIDAYKHKQRTPIFGGVVFLLVATVVSFGLALTQGGDWPLVSVVIHTLLFAAIGLVDDIKIIREGKNDGLSGKVRLLMQAVFALSFVLTTVPNDPIPILMWTMSLPDFVMIPLRIFMIMGAINAFNITDGMDGLAGGLAVLVLVGLSGIAWIQDASLLVFTLALIGALAAFLRFNFSPAKIFMGDVGSYGLGGALMMIAMLLNQEVSFIFFFAVFLWEIMCVIIQQVAVRLFKRRVFSYTPIHYAFVLKGMREKKVVLHFYVLGLISLGIGLLVFLSTLMQGGLLWL